MPRVNDLTTGGSLSTTDEVVVLQSGVVIKAPLSLIPFVQSGSGAIAENLQSRGRWFVYVTDFMSDADRAAIRAGTAGVDISAPLTLAIAALPSTGGIIDCRMITAAVDWDSTVTFSKAGIILLLPKSGRMTASALPLISVSTNCSGWEVYGISAGSNNGTVMRYTGTSAGDFVAAAKDANYGRVKGILFECTGSLAGRVNAVHCTDVFDFEYDNLFVSDATTGSHTNSLAGVYMEVATTSQVPPRGHYRFGSMQRSSSSDADVAATTGSRGIEVLGIASGVVENVYFHGNLTLETVENAIRLEKVAYVNCDVASKLAGNVRSLVCVDVDSGYFKGLSSRANGAARFVEHANIDANCFDLDFKVDFETSFGTNSGTRCYVDNSASDATSFTPGISFGGGTTGITYTRQIGRHIKYKNRIFFQIYVELSAKGSSTGQALITGLPTAAENTTGVIAAVAMAGGTLSSISGALMGFINPGATTIVLQHLGTGSQANLDDTNFNNTSYLIAQGSYQV